ncbi:MAG: amidohydrolase family protein [Sediminibacterium sp.]|nr:amidohydrolase family protein [Sediminibacterium sp.]
MRKWQPQHIFTGTELLPEDQVLLTDDAGSIIDIIPATEAGENIEKLPGWMSPAFINCHCHLELSHMKGTIPTHTGLVNFVQQVMQQRNSNAEMQIEAIKGADKQIWESGTQAVGDICNQSITAAIKSDSPVTYHSFIELAGWHPSVAESRYQNGLDCSAVFNKLQLPHSFSPHAPYSISAALWEKIQPHFSSVPVTLHNQESIDEQILFEKGTGNWIQFYEQMGIAYPGFEATGKSSLQSVFPFLQSATTLLLVHNTFSAEQDIQQVENLHPEIYWCICIRANKYIENALPPIDLLQQQGCKIVIGTDSLASNYSLNILDELKTIQQAFPQLSTPTLLTWATYQGAKALQLDRKLGQLSRGTKPGILHINQLAANGKLQQETTVERLF